VCVLAKIHRLVMYVHFECIYKGDYAFLMTDILQVLMPWKFNGCYTLFVIDHVKKHVTFIDFTPTQDWYKHMPYKRFAEAIIMASKKYKIAYNKKRSGWEEDIFKWKHTI
jgi:sentrin-specific protease 1